MKKKILFVCIHNSARSQMAEGLLRHLYGDSYEAYSAGMEPTGIHPLAVQAMGEMGIDISHQLSKGLDDLGALRFDLAVTVCGPEASCPLVTSAQAVVHREFQDPSATNDIGTFRKIRDELSAWIKDVFGPLAGNRAGGGRRDNA